jgi:hypothetical protein
MDEIAGAAGKKKIEEQRAEINKSIREQLSDNTQYEKVEETLAANKVELEYEMVVLDIFPDSVIKELELDEPVKRPNK